MQIEVAGADESRIGGPQPGHRLANVTERLLHGARADAERAFRESAIAVSLGEDLEERDGVVDLLEERRDAQLGAEMFPNFPSPVLGRLALRNNGGARRCLRKAEVRAKFISGGRGQSCQGCACG